jgi:hypothetical protein
VSAFYRRYFFVFAEPPSDLISHRGTLIRRTCSGCGQSYGVFDDWLNYCPFDGKALDTERAKIAS